MPDLTLVILAAGNSTRFGERVKKQWIRVGADPLWLFVAKRFASFYSFKKIIITSTPDELAYMRHFSSDFEFISGGENRQTSIENALSLVDTPYVMVTDVARACIPKALVLKMIENYSKADIIVPYIDVADTVVYEDSTIDRDRVKLIQTPQLSKSKILKEAIIKAKSEYSDDSSAIKAIGGKVFYLKGDTKAKKITRYDDLSLLDCLEAPQIERFVGNGFDVHQFQENREMFLCGVKIDSKFGFRAQSDGDVAIHALIDALLGAIGGGDIGELFPDSDEMFKDIDSKILLTEVISFITKVGFEVVNVDITIMAETPKLSPYKELMRRSISALIGVEPIRVNIKATTTEKLGFIGRKEGVAVMATAQLKTIEK